MYLRRTTLGLGQDLYIGLGLGRFKGFSGLARIARWEVMGQLVLADIAHLRFYYVERTVKSFLKRFRNVAVIQKLEQEIIRAEKFPKSNSKHFYIISI